MIMDREQLPISEGAMPDELLNIIEKNGEKDKS
jgi:hypothetical protein